MEEFYKVHCTKCGKVLSANDMAIDIDKMLRIHLPKAARKSGNKEILAAIKIFDEIRIGMYLTEKHLKEDGVLAEDGNLQLTGQYILNFIENRYKVDLTDLRKVIESGEEDEEDFFYEDNEAENDSDDLWKEQVGGANLEISPKILNDLSFKMRLYKEKDSSKEEKKRFVRELLLLLLECREEIFLECECKFVYQEDDQGGKFISSVKETYIDGEVIDAGHMVCPFCGEPFFADAGKYEEHIVVMLGSSRVGKTSYLAALVEAVDPQYGQSKYKDISIRDIADAEFNRFKEEILKPYRQGEKIKKTEVQKEAAALFSLGIAVKGRNATFTFVDLPGEVFVPTNDEENKSGEVTGAFIINERKICESADMFWFCIDPVQIDQRLYNVNEEANDMDKVEQDMNLVFASVGRNLDVMGSRKKDIPTAVMITKSDLIPREENLYFRSRELEPECRLPDGSFAVDRFQNMSANVIKYLQSDNVKNVISKLDNMFVNKNYFAVAAYGGIVDEDSERNGKAPSGILIPFLWSLAAFGYIKPKQFGISRRTLGIFRKREIIKENYFEAPREALFVHSM